MSAEQCYLLYTQNFSKIAKVHTTAWVFDNEGLVEINFGVKVDEKALMQLYNTF
jgi:hypothetical protein